jgi:tetratricopeptide (TPR) repeat protein
MEEGKLQDASAIVTAIRDDRPEVQHLRGLIAFRLHDYPRAIQAMTKSAAAEKTRSPELRESLLVLGQSYFLSGKMPEATAVLEKASSEGVNLNELNYMLSVAYIQQRKREEASRSVAALFGVVSNSAAAHVLAAQMMIRQEFEDLAIEELKRALELNPKLAGVHYLLGELAVYSGDAERGIAEFQAELAVNPNSSNAYWKIGDAYGRREDWDRAIPFLQRSIWLNPDFSAPYILIGKAYWKKKDYGNAEGMLRQAIRMDPENQSAHYMLGQVLMQSGRTEEGRKMLERSQQLRQVNSR